MVMLDRPRRKRGDGLAPAKPSAWLPTTNSTITTVYTVVGVCAVLH